MKILSVCALFLVLLLSGSCEKVIDIKVPDTDPVPVIEAVLEQDSLCRVQLSSTMDIFDDLEILPFIENAVITLSDDLGANEVLIYKGMGQYEGLLLRGSVGRTYTLTVVVEEVEYKAESVLRPVVPIDSISIIAGLPSNPNSIYRRVYLHYTDPVGAKNNYFIKFFYFPNSSANTSWNIERSYLLNDANRNGQAVEQYLFAQPMESGDVIFAELRSIDQAVFDYYFSINDALYGGGFTSAAPANPDSNFSNGALGYFGAWSKSLEILMIP
jgi:hypothetical protein